jgi:hypothetical protein
MTPIRGSIRREVRIQASAGEAWSLVGDPARLAEWFPGITACIVEGDTRLITTGSGLPIPEQIVTVDPLQRRFQYRVTAPMFTEHLATIDVIDLKDGTILVIYGVDAVPSMMALVLGGAGGNALSNLRRILEGKT